MELQDIYNQYDKNIEELNVQIAQIETKKDDLFIAFLNSRDKIIDEIIITLQKEREDVIKKDTLLDIIIKKIKK